MCDEVEGQNVFPSGSVGGKYVGESTVLISYPADFWKEGWLLGYASTHLCIGLRKKPGRYDSTVHKVLEVAVHIEM